MSKNDPFTAADRRQMRQLGIAPEEALRQLELYRNPPPPSRILRPGGLGDGIRTILPGDEPELLAHHARAARAGRIHKLVPASGAASRMFQPLLSSLERLERLDRLERRQQAPAGESLAESWAEPDPDVRTFFSELPRFAFFEDLAAAAAAHGLRLESGATAVTALTVAQRRTILASLLTAAGLAYAARPKGLILFHRYPEGPRTAFDEHLVEATDDARDDGGTCRLHFTVATRHEPLFRTRLAGQGADLGRRLGSRFEVSFSHQPHSTDTLAVDSDLRPFRLAGGELLFRPGGHGALLDNLQQLAGGGAGIVLLKNIDNVVPDARRPKITRWKKLLAGTLLTHQEEVFRLLDGLAAELPDPPLIEEAARFAERQLSRPLPGRFSSASPAEQRYLLLAALDRPLRVAGMVRNTGEPGGGPFWVESPDGEVSLQIVETSQIGREPHQRAALAAATHFNPTDLACALYDRRGRPYDLQRFVDPSTVFIAAKSHEGRPLLALEHPGLWNGAMAGWNTVFVEIPNAIFAPVKTVLDLLRPEHQG